MSFIWISNRIGEGKLINRTHLFLQLISWGCNWFSPTLKLNSATEARFCILRHLYHLHLHSSIRHLHHNMFCIRVPILLQPIFFIPQSFSLYNPRSIAFQPRSRNNNDKDFREAIEESRRRKEDSTSAMNMKKTHWCAFQAWTRFGPKAQTNHSCTPVPEPYTPVRVGLHFSLIFGSQSPRPRGLLRFYPVFHNNTPCLHYYS